MIEELRTFVAVTRFGTFSLAADRIGLTQSAVSGHVRRLEDRFGFTLFDRTGRSATLNAAGARTLPRAQEILRLVDAIADPDADAATGSLRVGVISSLQSSMLTRALVAFRDRYPKLRVHVVPGLSLHLLDQVDAGELDLALLIRPPFDLPAELEWCQLSREPYVLIVPAATEGDDWRRLLQTQPFLRYDRLSFGGRQVERFLRSLPFAVTEATEVPAQAMLTMVQSGLGVALISSAEAHRPLPRGVRAVPLTGEKLFREIGLVRPRRSHPNIAADHLASCFAAAVPSASGQG